MISGQSEHLKIWLRLLVANSIKTLIPRHSSTNTSVKYSTQRALLLCIVYYELSDNPAAYIATVILHPHYRMRWFEEHWKKHPQ